MLIWNNIDGVYIYCIYHVKLILKHAYHPLNREKVRNFEKIERKGFKPK